ncbi:unnamed protein product [Candida verbasci]|uniref:Uncharacterized protein n=1 Tax=Candida verbasci TaxID=1227364 RepID=A0A9W4TY20_9ASCO|nr:unnamed protein product [Candida verbasci]
MSFIIPDLRFEQSFMKQLDIYAGNKRESKKPSAFNKRNYIEIATLTDKELDNINDDIDLKEQKELLKPLNPITPSIILYAIIKDQIIMPLLQGFLWTGILLSIRPVLQLVVKNGQTVGGYISNLLGINQLNQRRRVIVG